MNVKLLRRVQTYLKTMPRNQFRMIDYEEDVFDKSGNVVGKTHCIGGIACLLRGRRASFANVQTLLGLSNDEALRLCIPSYWPNEAPLNYKKAFNGWKATPKQAAKRVELFITSKGAE